MKTFIVMMSFGILIFSSCTLSFILDGFADEPLTHGEAEDLLYIEFPQSIGDFNTNLHFANAVVQHKLTRANAIVLAEHLQKVKRKNEFISIVSNGKTLPFEEVLKKAEATYTKQEHLIEAHWKGDASAFAQLASVSLESDWPDIIQYLESDIGPKRNLQLDRTLQKLKGFAPQRPFSEILVLSGVGPNYESIVHVVQAFPNVTTQELRDFFVGSKDLNTTALPPLSVARPHDSLSSLREHFLKEYSEEKLSFMVTISQIAPDFDPEDLDRYRSLFRYGQTVAYVKRIYPDLSLSDLGKLANEIQTVRDDQAALKFIQSLTDHHFDTKGSSFKDALKHAQTVRAKNDKKAKKNSVSSSFSDAPSDISVDSLIASLMISYKRIIPEISFNAAKELADPVNSLQPYNVERILKMTRHESAQPLYFARIASIVKDPKVLEGFLNLKYVPSEESFNLATLEALSNSRLSYMKASSLTRIFTQRHHKDYLDFIRDGGDTEYLYSLHHLQDEKKSTPQDLGQILKQAKEATPSVRTAFHRNRVMERCPTFDFRQQFPPIRDQSERGLCWAYVASDLLGQKLCQQNPTLCGKPLSALDIGRAFWGVGTANEKGFVSSAINYALQNGVCLETDTILVRKKKSFERLKELFEETQKSEIACERDVVPSVAPQVPSLDETIQDILNDIYNSEGDENVALLTGNTLRKAIKQSRTSDFSRFLMNLLIPENCNNARLGVSIEPGAFHGLKSYSKTEIGSNSGFMDGLKFIAEAARNNSAVGLTLCANRLLGREDCGKHAISVLATRFVPKIGRCEGFLRNSWGDGSQLNGWHDLEAILKETQTATYVGSHTQKSATVTQHN